MKKVVSLLILIFFIVPAQVRAGANHESPSGSDITIAQTSKKKTSGNKQRKNKPTGKKTPVNANKSAPSRPTPLAPPDAALIADWSVGFSWTGSPGKASYRLQVSNRPSFTPTNLDAVTAAKSYKPTAVLPPGVYYWRIKAMNAFKKGSAWSKVRRFMIRGMAPSNTTASNFINRGEASTDSAAVSLAIAAASYVGISGYYVSESPAPPDAKASRWATVTPPTSSYSSAVPYTLSSGDGTKTVYVWFKDIDERLSGAATDSIILDTRPAETMITSRPTVTSNFGPASFGFTSSKAGAKFACALDSGSYSACSSPITYESLAEGRHTFKVKVINTATNIEASPASYTWAVIRPLINTMPSKFINRTGIKYFIAKKTVILSLSAVATAEEESVVGYFASESPDMPEASDPAWKTFAPVKKYSKDVPFTLSDGYGTKRIYVWFKDTADNISEVKNDKIVYINSKYLLIMLLVLQAAFVI